MIVTLRFWAARDDPRTVLVRTTSRPILEPHGLTVDGEVTEGDGLFEIGAAVVFVPLRQLLWAIVREDRP